MRNDSVPGISGRSSSVGRAARSETAAAVLVVETAQSSGCRAGRIGGYRASRPWDPGPLQQAANWSGVHAPRGPSVRRGRGREGPRRGSMACARSRSERRVPDPLRCRTNISALNRASVTASREELAASASVSAAARRTSIIGTDRRHHGHMRGPEPDSPPGAALQQRWPDLGPLSRDALVVTDERPVVGQFEEEATLPPTAVKTVRRATRYHVLATASIVVAAYPLLRNSSVAASTHRRIVSRRALHGPTIDTRARKGRPAREHLSKALVDPTG